MGFSKYPSWGILAGRMNVRALAIAISLLSIKLIGSDEFVISLKDPTYSDGIVQTEEGGVISAPDLRIQARNITYIDKTEDGVRVQKIVAKADLMMLYQGRVFVGDTLEFDLLTKTGYLIDGRAGIESWFVGGDRIDLADDGTVTLYGAFATTTVSRANPWAISTDDATINGYILDARDVRFTAFDRTILWLPRYKSNLRRYFKDPALRYRLLWDTWLGPRLSVRWRFFSNETFASYLRFDYRLKKGPGGALEAEYKSLDGLTLFQTRNYGAHDLTFPKENGQNRYRFQGLWTSKSADEYTRFRMQWDKMSDDRMVGDFKDSDFEVNTQKATYLEFISYQDYGFVDFAVRPKINFFNSIAQELPQLVFGIRPFKIWGTGIISENYANGAYLDYTFANYFDKFKNPNKPFQNFFSDQLEKAFDNFHSVRIETNNALYRPISLWGLTATPRVGLVSIFYTQTPEHDAKGQLLYEYGGDLNYMVSKEFGSFRHSIEPYAKYLGYTRPQLAVDNYFVFDIHDGYDRLDQLKFGLRQLFYSYNSSTFLPTISLDFYSYAFWGATSFNDRIPKVFAELKINQPSWSFRTDLGWNIQEHLLDFGNAKLLWTLSASLAFGVEFRHRSEFWWRKANYDNYVVDFARDLENLLASPLSDRRDTLLFNAHVRLSPRWNLNVQSHHGWERFTEPPYTGAKVEFYTMLSGSWQMRLGYEYLPNDPFRFSYSFKLIK